jgi:hypothetical protein
MSAQYRSVLTLSLVAVAALTANRFCFPYPWPAFGWGKYFGRGFDRCRHWSNSPSRYAGHSAR